MSATEVSTALLALSRLGARNRAPATSNSNSAEGRHRHQLPLQLSMRLLRRAHDTLPSSTPRDLVTMAYALAKLELNPGAWWWARVLPFSAAALHVCTPSMLAVLAWSLAKLDVQPGAGWTQELLQHTGEEGGWSGTGAALLLNIPSWYTPCFVWLALLPRCSHAPWSGWEFSGQSLFVITARQCLAASG